MIKLVSYQEKLIYRGNIIKFEDILDKDKSAFAMICEISGREGYQLIRMDGYKAGIPIKIFKNESIEGYGISTEWLIENYLLWTYIDCGIENIYVLSEPSLDLFDY